MAVITFDGHIMGASFASGDRIVAGRWSRSPFGAFADVMWCRPDGRRVLLAPDERVRDFVAGHYAFDELAIDDVRVERAGDGAIEATAGPVRLVLRARPPGPASTLLTMRPRRLRTWRPWISLEDLALRPFVQPLFAAAAGVRTTGVTFAGAREWYAIHDLREADAEASIDGVDLGAPAACEPAGFGFSEFPSQPAIVRVTSIFAEMAPRAAPAAALSG
jgi:hypothetical protein